MGQYHYIVNLDKREYVNPSELGSGLKAWEQLASFPASPQALFVLLVCSNGRGGGDLNAPADIDESVIGRWAGDRIAVIGDYAEDDDIHRPCAHPVSEIYGLCIEGVYRDITRLVRPVIEAELGVEYYPEEFRMRSRGGGEETFSVYRFRRSPTAGFSVLD